jgi:hypothetical protein
VHPRAPGGCAPKSIWQLAAVMVMRIRVVWRRTRRRFAPTPALLGTSSSYRPIRAISFLKRSKCCQLFCVYRKRALLVPGIVHPYFSVGPSSQREGIRFLSRRAGSSGISWRILSLAKKDLNCHRAGFEPQRASSFRKRVKAPQVLRGAVKA